MTFRAYDSYHESGHEWLKELPSHWAIERLKRLCDVRPSNVDKKSYGDEEPVRLCNYTDAYYNERITPAIEFMEATASQEQIDRFGLRAGDVIVTKDSETADDIAISAYVPETMPGVVCGYHLALLRPRSGAHGGFVKRFFDSKFAKACVAVRANGLTRVGLGQYALDNLLIPTPPKREQEAIAAFLDRETAKIDALVEEQRRLIDLLKEKRQAVISRAVTKGLDPTAPMQDSGAEPLGDVPAHWTVTRLKRVVPAITVGIVVEPSKHYAEAGVPALRSLNVRPGRISPDDLVFISDEANALHSKSKLRAGDIVAVRTGQPGTAAIIPSDFDGTNCIDLIIIRKGDEVCEHFLCWFLASDAARQQFAEGSGGAIQLHFNVAAANQLALAVPPLDEQRRIAVELECRIAKLDALLSEAGRATDLLQERRAGLISAAVTGKIDVRERAAAPAELESA